MTVSICIDGDEIIVPDFEKILSNIRALTQRIALLEGRMRVFDNEIPRWSESVDAVGKYV